MKIKKLIVGIMAFSLLATGMIVKDNIIKVHAEEAKAIEFSEENVNLAVKPGETNHLRLPIRSVGTFLLTPEASISDTNVNSPFTFTKPSLLTKADTQASLIDTSDTTYVVFDVKVDETAVIGAYPVTLKITGTDPVLTETGYQKYQLEFVFNLQILEEKAPAQLSIKDVNCNNPFIGTDADLSFSVKNEGEITARNVYITLNYGDTGLIANYTKKKIKVGDITPGNDQYITLPISILSTASAGEKTITVNFEYKNIDGTSLTDSYNFKIVINKNEKAPDIYIENVTYKGKLSPGGEFTLAAKLSNIGGSTAKEIYVSVDESTIAGEGFIKKFYSDIWVPDIKKDNTDQVEIPLAVSLGATGGIKNLKINISYTDASGINYIKTETVYPEVIGNEQTGESNIIISGVKQSPSQPVAGDKLNVSFDIENKGASDISELKIALDKLNGDTFIPIESEPYKYIEKLAGGAKIRITFPLIVSDTIPEGLNNLGITYTYAGGQGSLSIPIRDIQNDLGSNSKPKLIVSKYSTDVEELKAGSTFNFTFDIYNTHSSVAAKNITVTVTQADNVFTVTQGSNSFFISKIDAGKTVSNTLEMKVKSDASTKTYPIKISIEYEYDGIEPNPETGAIGETKIEELSLQAEENSRPVVDYVNVYSYDGNIIVSNPASLSFEFYNMGKSPLNNVVATVEGDFTKSDGSMYFIGNVEPGGTAYADFEVIPNVEGTAKGVVKISFENSNGEQVGFTKDFEAMVMGAQVIDPGMGEGGAGEVFNPTAPVVKKQIVPIWLFIIIQVVIFAAFVPITRKAIISIYRSKLRKKEEENY